MNITKIIILILTIYTLPALTQITLRGNIKDEQTKLNLPNVSIYMSDLKMNTSSDSLGNFKFSKLKQGSYLIDISVIGYKSIVKSIQLTKDVELQLTLSPKINEMNEVVVTGVSRSMSLKSSPVIIKTIDRYTMNQNSATNLIDGLKNVPGINLISTGPAIAKPVIRGLGYNRVITLNNGIRQEGQQWGDEHGIEMDEYAVDRVEIVKGPGSLMYGSDGIAGVLNFLAPKLPALEKMHTQLVTNFQSNNNMIGYSLSNAGNKNGYQWMGRWSNKLAGNYQNAYDGKVLNSGFKEYDGSIFLGVNKSWGHSHLTFSSFSQTLNLIEGERDSMGHFTYQDNTGNVVTASPSDYNGYKTGFPHQELHHLRIASNNYFILNKGTINADFGFQNNKRKEFGDPVNPTDIALFFDLNTFNYNIKYNLQKYNGWETSVGIGGMQQSNTNKGLEFLIPQYNLFDIGLFAFSQKTFDRLTLAGGIRYDKRFLNSSDLYLDSTDLPTSSNDPNASSKFIALSKTFSGFSGSLGVSYQINKISTLKVNLSRGYRAPNMAELSSNGRHEGTFRYEIGNQSLPSEISHQVDIAYFFNSEHVTFECTPFVNFINNYIFSEKLKTATGMDSIPNPADPAPAYQFSSGNATLMGGELYFDIHPHPYDWLHFENSFSYVRATQNRQPDSTQYLPFIPAPKYRAEVKAQFSQWGKALSNLYIKFGMDYYLAQRNIFYAYGTETATPAYILFNAGFGTNIKAFKQKNCINLFFSATNLADIAYQNNLNRLKYAPANLMTGRVGVFNMGRNFSLKVVLNF